MVIVRFHSPPRKSNGNSGEIANDYLEDSPARYLDFEIMSAYPMHDLT